MKFITLKNGKTVIEKNSKLDLDEWCERMEPHIPKPRPVCPVCGKEYWIDTAAEYHLIAFCTKSA